MTLKIRIIPTLLYKDMGLVKGVGFDSWRRVGSAMQAIKVYNLREVDELILLDITATLENRSPDIDLIDELADDCFMPFSVGGGIRTITDVKNILRAGADKVVLNTAVIEKPELIRQIADKYGSQCVVVSIDAKKVGPGSYQVYTHSGTVATEMNPVEVAQSAEANGAGEILVTSIERDGTMTGYEIELIRQVSDAVNIPVIASGGAGNFDHMAEALRDGKGSSVAAASIFHFTQQTPLEAKHYLKEAGFNVRL